MITCYLSSQGVQASERTVQRQLHDRDPSAYENCRRHVRVQNPIPYFAAHFGEKLRIDQNEKLPAFGVFHAACIDGFSGKIVRHIIIHQKNNILLYDHLYRPIVSETGMWEYLRTDMGTEWNLILFVQNLLQQYRGRTAKPPFIQTFSKQNLRIERWWVEVNKRVN